MIKQTMGWISAICGVIGAICSGWKLMLLPVVRILNMIADKKIRFVYFIDFNYENVFLRYL